MRNKLASIEAWRAEAQAEVAGLQVQLSTERSSSQAQLLSLKKQLKAEHVSIIGSVITHVLINISCVTCLSSH